MVIRFAMLGDVEVRVDDRLVDVGHARQRCVLVALLVDVGRVVSSEVLAERVWGDRLPALAVRSLASYVSRLRRALAEAEGVGIERRLAGYVLTADLESVDLHVFRRLLGEARSAAGDEVVVGLFDRALGLWRGEAFGGLDTPWTNALRVTVNRERLAAELDRNDIELRRGRHDEVLARVSALVSAHSLDERCVGQLMVVLYRCGRQAEALECYQQIRVRLAEELGIDPGPALQQLHQRILTADPTLNTPVTSSDAVGPSGATDTARVARVPRQLPRDLATFVGRGRELATLAGVIEAAAGSTVGPVVVIHGAPGVGKSTLAIRAAHAAMSRFPDGQLHVNLRGATPGVSPLSATEALHQLLRALGVTGSEMPSGVEEAAGLFRTVVAERRLLVVLDNAATAAQVRPLLPSSPGNVVLITSRSRFATLEGATHLALGPLDPDDAKAVLEAMISGVRTAMEADATQQLAELCGWLPLGLHVAAARLNARPRWAVHELVDRLADERNRLNELAAGDIALRSSIAVSYTTLHDSDNPDDQEAARALCLFGLLPTSGLDTDLAAAVLGTTSAEADRIIERLLDAHLVEETAPGRCHLHDLIRLFARERGADTIPRNAQDQALVSLLSHHLATTSRANTLVYPHRVHHPAPAVETPPTPLADHDEALRWLDEQHPTMIAAIHQAWLGPTEHARLGVALALALHWYRFLDSGLNNLQETISFFDGAIKAAERLGDRRSQAYAHGTLATHLSHLGQLDQACAHNSAELAICREIGDRFGEQRALGNLGYTYVAQRRPEQAIDCLQQQLELARDIDAPLGQAFALVNLGKAHHQLGHTGEAITLIETGMAWYEKTGDHHRQCDTYEVIARMYLDLGQCDQAIILTLDGLEHARHISYRFGEICALTALARAHRLSGNMDTAREYAEQAVAASATLDGIEARTEALIEYSQLHPDT